MVYTLTYFGMPGRAEIGRLIMEVGGVSYKNEFVVFKEWLTSLKGVKRYPFGQIPALQDGDFILCQSGAIARHLAKEANLYPENPRAAAISEMFFEGITEWRNKAYSVWFSPDGKDAMDNYVTKTVPFYLDIFEKAINEQGLLGNTDKVSYVDLALWDILQENKYTTIYKCDKYPKLDAHYSMISSIKSIQDYLNSNRRPPSIDEFLDAISL
ncbi:glutathione S-transferase P [Acrasis kona]|uniref:Glutathione S-transferase P n=1 Tax=Acrasis kona TaxID=1008807 RepID=A0AAW2ZE12_9EUKA